jgi:hypothetical protein
VLLPATIPSRARIYQVNVTVLENGYWSMIATDPEKMKMTTEASGPSRL